MRCRWFVEYSLRWLERRRALSSSKDNGKLYGTGSGLVHIRWKEDDADFTFIEEFGVQQSTTIAHLVV